LHTLTGKALLLVYQCMYATSSSIYAPDCYTQQAQVQRKFSVPCSTSYSFSSLAYGSYSLTSASFGMTAHADQAFDFVLHLLTPTDFRSFSVV
jgi:hypothetical protein